MQGFGFALLDNEIAIYKWACTNVLGKTGRRQCLVGSLTGAVPS